MIGLNNNKKDKLFFSLSFLLLKQEPYKDYYNEKNC
jgi:hypothetical protein